MPTARQTATYEIAGLSFKSTIEKTQDTPIGQEVALPAGQAGTLTTRTDDDTGEATLTDTPSVANGDKVDVYWDGGVRYGMTVGTVSGNDVPLDLGAGDNLPAATTAIVVTERVQANFSFDGDDLQMIVAICDQRAHIDFEDSGNVSLEAVELPAAGEAWSWIADTPAYTNPLTGNDVHQVQASNGTATAATVTIAALYDSTP
jgi:hypothetical protein